MKILFVFGGKQKGGAERVITNLANNMIKKHDVYFLGLKKMNTFYEINDNIKYDFIEQAEDYKSNFFIRNFNRTRRMYNSIRSVSPDIIISFSREQSYRLLLTNFFNKRKIIISVRNDPKEEYKNFFEKCLMKILYLRVNGFVFQTEEARSFFPKSFQEKSVIIPNPINEDYIDSFYEGERKNVIVTAGRLAEQKNHELLIDAFSKISGEFKDYKLIIYGSGSLENDLKEQIKRLKLEKRVILAGEVSCIKDKIINASLFVLSSRYEGMPNALIEAMALGLPCISTDCPCGGPRYLIKNNINGVLVPVGDENKLSFEMKRLLNDKDLCLKLSKNATKVAELLNPNKINKLWIDFIEEILGK